ncbi:MAG TPA: DUF3455 domain-containing protein [Polyangia bacterium]
MGTLAWTTAVITVGAVGVVACGCGGDPTSPAAADTWELSRAVSSRACPPPPPDPALAVPAGNRLAFGLDAEGVQIYQCVASAAGLTWTFQAPEATLLNPGGQTAGRHFAGPTWQTNDQSSVVGARVAAAIVDPSAIPWLLLSAVTHDGSGRMAKVSFIQRFDTVGGLAPTTSCETAGTVARIDYRATYLFYEPEHGAPQGPACP